jgi:hypothetical protein
VLRLGLAAGTSSTAKSAPALCVAQSLASSGGTSSPSIYSTPGFQLSFACHFAQKGESSFDLQRLSSAEAERYHGMQVEQGASSSRRVLMQIRMMQRNPSSVWSPSRRKSSSKQAQSPLLKHNDTFQVVLPGVGMC